MANALIPDEVEPGRRAARALELRVNAARAQSDQPAPKQTPNGDEAAYASRLGSYTKGLPRVRAGAFDADPAAYDLLLAAIRSALPSDFDKVPLGGTVKLSDPQATYAFSLDGPDAARPVLPPPPAFHSAEQAGELVEDYWMAALRDVPFRNYGTDARAAAAAADLDGLSAFKGPRDGGHVTPATLFRGPTAGDAVGPYVSQLLYHEVPCGAMRVQQRYRTPLAGDDQMTSWDEWLAIESGAAPARPAQWDPTPRYVRDGRGLAEFVHRDFVHQAFLNAALVLQEVGAISPANPYAGNRNQSGFVTFGPVHVIDLLGRVTRSALKAAWYQKWAVHRRARPEELGGRVHQHKTGLAAHPLHDDVVNSRALAVVYSRWGGYLLPQAYPEGAPTHPSYPAGHACMAGACATLLKAFFDEKATLPNPVEPSEDGLALLPWSGTPALTVGNELNKLASNVALGRDFAGLHWRSDGWQGMLLGEQVTLNLLREEKTTYPEAFSGFTLTRFDGARVTV
jgi:hypothetical protein